MQRALSLYRVAYINSLLVILLSLTVLATWQFDLIGVKNIFPEQQISNPITTICFLLSGFSILLLAKEKEGQYTGRITACIVVLIASIVLCSDVFHYSTRIDKWLYTDKLIVYGNRGKPNYMAPNTATCFCFLGLSLVFYRYRSGIRKYFSDVLAMLCLSISFVSVVGYLYKANEFYNVKSYIPIAFPTAISFFLLSMAVLFYRSRFGLFNVFTAPYAGTRVARSLIPLAFLVPVVIGALRIKGQNAELFSGNLGGALVATANAVIFIFLIWRTSIYLNKVSKKLDIEMKERTRLNKEMEVLNLRLQKKVEDKTRQLIAQVTKHQKQMLEASIEVQEKERKQIGMELHDNINQTLASIGLYLDIGINSPELKDEMIKRSKSQIHAVINEIRSLSKSLVSHKIETGELKEGILEIVAPIEESRNIEFDIQISDVAEVLNLDQTVAVYRIVQEQLNNIVKYADASHVTIGLFEKQNQIHLLIKDDGRGFDPNRKRTGIGLGNIESRAEVLNGKMKIVSEPEQGCELNVMFPMTICA